MSRICIPDYEYKERVARAAELVRQKGLDVMVVSSTESDYANARYFSGFWPLFERAGVAISATGDAALMVGPECIIFAQDVAKMDKIFCLREFRESADPSYPELQASTFRDVFRAIGVTGENIKIGLGSYVECTLPIFEGVKESFPKAEITKCNDIMAELRQIKSKNELACIREGFRIVDIATDEVIRQLQPGVTELQMVGVAQRVIYEEGAEYEGLPMYVFSEKSTSHAISRSHCIYILFHSLTRRPAGSQKQQPAGNRQYLYKCFHNLNIFKLVGHTGFEPVLTEPKSVVLPLHQCPM